MEDYSYLRLPGQINIPNANVEIYKILDFPGEEISIYIYKHNYLFAMGYYVNLGAITWDIAPNSESGLFASRDNAIIFILQKLLFRLIDLSPTGRSHIEYLLYEKIED